MLLLPVVNGCLAAIHDCSFARLPDFALSTERNSYLGHVNVTLKSQVKKGWAKQAAHASKAFFKADCKKRQLS